MRVLLQGKRRDGLEWGRHVLSFAVLLITAGLVAAMAFAPGDQTASRYSPGPVSAVHQAWANDCGQCHADSAPQRTDAAFAVQGSSDRVWSRPADRQCRHCHPVAGLDDASKATSPYLLAQHAPAGSLGATELPQQVDGCAVCHREHPRAGVDGSIIDLRDDSCVSCHRNLQAVSRGKPLSKNSITAFALDDHPPFPSLSKPTETRPLRFTHQRHMALGLSSGEVGALKKTWTEAIPDPEQRRRYLAEGADPESLVQLNCNSCHESTDVDSNPTISLSKQLGDRVIAMPNYESHCKACHPLDYVPGDRDRQVPHGMDSAALRELLKAKFSPTSGEEPFLRPFRRQRGLSEAETTPSEDAAREGRLDEAALPAAIAHVTGRCLQCHRPQSGAGRLDLPQLQAVPYSRNPATAAGQLAAARFSHRAHLTARMRCSDCHHVAPLVDGQPLADGSAAPDSVSPSGVSIPNIDNCVQCHTTQPIAEKSPFVAAPTNCLTCHQYHHHRPAAVDGDSTAPSLSLNGQGPADGAWEREKTFHQPASPSLLLSLVGLLQAEDQGSPRARRIGVHSCSATGCHGGTDDQTQQAWKSSYTVWRRNDPHARAYQTLFNQRSRRMVAQLISEPLTREQYTELLAARCNGCHATHSQDDSTRGLSVAEGVSCESCHGAAGDWGAEHWRTQWERATPNSGFRDLKQLDVRAARCVGCHLGPVEVNGRTLQVDHDLLAAGHPRLRFEFHSHLADLPPHWRLSSGQGVTALPAESPARRWSVGEQQTTRTVLNRLAWRAETASQEAIASAGEPAGEDVAVVWPEFEEYSCDSCHHSLGGTPGEQSGFPFRLSWAGWLFPPPRNGSSPPVGAFDVANGSSLARLQREMTHLDAPPERIARLAKETLNEAATGKSARREVEEDEDKDARQRLRRRVLSDIALRSWDDLARWRLIAVAAIDMLRQDEADDVMVSLDEQQQRFSAAMQYPFSTRGDPQAWSRAVAEQQRLQRMLNDLFSQRDR